MQGDAFAHKSDDIHGGARWHRLSDHLRDVASLSGRFASTFDSEQWGLLAGLWHDLGKYQDEFQRRIRGEAIHAEHSGIGAVVAADAGLYPLAFAICGHHGGLPNHVSSEDSDGLTPLKERVRKNRGLLEKVRGLLPSDLLQHKAPPPPEFIAKGDTATLEFWTRFLFSALVDADWLDTETFMASERGANRGGFDSIPVLRQRLDAHIDQIAAGLTSAERALAINESRRAVLNACRAAATCEPGLFSLTAPTGSGKTLAGMSFALNHAKTHGLRRVIVVLPYTTIIEQNALVYRHALNDENVIEHHSNLDPASRKATSGVEVAERHDLAAENWDAPIVVTTSVQFFESLFSNRRSQCRKLHNIARSVVVLDEVQSLPPDLLTPILSAMKELTAHYGCSMVLSTATQPALNRRKTLEEGLEGVREIIPDVAGLSRQLERVRYEWPAPDAPPLTYEDLAAQLAQHRQALAVVHKRADAQELALQVAQCVPNDCVYHLSTLMCARHRVRVLNETRKRLTDNEPCILIATQLIEAGVDIDFPVVYRALGGLDSVVQAAGRCNREGKHPLGRVIIFRAPTAPPKGTPQQGAQVTESMLAVGCLTDATPGPEVFLDYFRQFYAVQTRDAHNVQRERRQFNFATVAHNFRMIPEDPREPVLIPFDGSEKMIEQLEREGPSRDLLRSLQPYLVCIYPQQLDEGLKAGMFREIAGGYYTLAPTHRHAYDSTYGLAGETVPPDPRALVF